MAHQQVLSVPSDLLVCLMTFMRLKIIMKVTFFYPQSLMFC